MINQYEALRDAIIVLVRQEEDAANLDPGIPPEEFQFIVNTIHTNVKKSVTKYINGIKEHGPGFLENVAHLHEAMNEVYDLGFFIPAAIEKMKQYDDRYK